MSIWQRRSYARAHSRTRTEKGRMYVVTETRRNSGLNGSTKTFLIALAILAGGGSSFLGGRASIQTAEDSRVTRLEERISTLETCMISSKESQMDKLSDLSSKLSAVEAKVDILLVKSGIHVTTYP